MNANPTGAWASSASSIAESHASVWGRGRPACGTDVEALMAGTSHTSKHSRDDPLPWLSNTRRLAASWPEDLPSAAGSQIASYLAQKHVTGRSEAARCVPGLTPFQVMLVQAVLVQTVRGARRPPE